MLSAGETIQAVLFGVEVEASSAVFEPRVEITSLSGTASLLDILLCRSLQGISLHTSARALDRMK